jgi:hypothetical protein
LVDDGFDKSSFEAAPVNFEGPIGGRQAGSLVEDKIVFAGEYVAVSGELLDCGVDNVAVTRALECL